MKFSTFSTFYACLTILISFRHGRVLEGGGTQKIRES